MLRTKYTEFTKNRMSTQAIESQIKGMNSVMSENSGFRKIMTKREPDFTKRLMFTGSLKHHKPKHHSLSNGGLT
jgi:hypothetical protein